MKILMINNINTTFIKQDYELLEGLYYNVKVIWPLRKNIIHDFGDALDADIIFSWWCDSLKSVLLAKLLRKPVVLIAGGTEIVVNPEVIGSCGALRYTDVRNPWNVIRNIITKFNIKHADAVLSVSEYAKNNSSQIAYNKNNIIVYNGIDIKHFKVITDKKEKIIVTSGGQKDDRIQKKGWYELIESFSIIHKKYPDYKLMFIGNDMGARNLLIEKAKKFGVLEWVIFEEYNLETMPEILSKSKIFVQFSRDETFALAMVEAMACGTPAIVSNKSALPEVLEYKNELIVDNYDIDSLAFKINELIENDDLYNKMREYCLELARKKYPLSKRKHALKNIFDDLCNKYYNKNKKEDVVVDIGCGYNKTIGAIGIDFRKITDVQALVDKLPLKSNIADKVACNGVIEHFENPYILLDEIHRIAKQNCIVIIETPNIGTYSMHLDRDHKFKADWYIWNKILKGYFEKVKSIPFGYKYRGNKTIYFLNYILVKIFRLNDFGQGHRFICLKPKKQISKNYIGWWMEE